MIGNDIVDLAKAKRDTFIFRPRYLDKLCSREEVNLVRSSSNSIQTFWRLWTMKETAYKAYQRQFSFGAKYNPFAFSSQLIDEEVGIVSYQNHTLITRSFKTDKFMYSEVSHSEVHNTFFGSTAAFLSHLKTEFQLAFPPIVSTSVEGLPMLKLNQDSIPFSKTHHGHFQAFQY